AEKNEDKCLSAMQTLWDASKSDPRVVKAIWKLAQPADKKDTKVASTAIKMLSNRTPRDLAFLKDPLLKMVDDKDLFEKPEKGGRPEYYKSILDGIAVYRDDAGGRALIKAQAKNFEKYIEKLLPDNAEFSTRLIRAYAAATERWSFEYLLKLAEQLESSGSGGGQGKVSEEAKGNRNKAKAAILEQFAVITGADVGDVAAWKKWYAEKSAQKGGYVFPTPNAAGAGGAGAAPAGPTIDPQAPEFKDEGY